MAEFACKFGVLQSGAQPIHDLEMDGKIRNLRIGDVADGIYDDGFAQRFMSAYHDWIRSSDMNDTAALDGYQRCMTFANTNAIEQWLMKHRERRILTFKGEYPGTMELIRGYGMRHGFADSEMPTNGDALLVSSPFSGTGNRHPMLDEVLSRCEAVSVPVMLDCAFFGTCRNLVIDSSPCIDAVAFSLSKCFGLHNHRIGMLYSNNPPAGIEVLNRYGYISRIGASIALWLFGDHSPDGMWHKYRRAQEAVCEELGGMVPSDTIMFANGDDRWAMFNRGGSCNRISFASFLGAMIR